MKIAILGSTGTIGNALVHQYRRNHPDAEIHTFSRSSKPDFPHHHTINYHDEISIRDAAQNAFSDAPFDVVVVATGILHDDTNLWPEKSLRDLSMEKFQRVFAANTIFPALAAKHFLPLLHRDKDVRFAALSARVGSISDNQLGGWYAYRASKAALNMIIKNCAIETARRHKRAIIVGLHPGTVNSALSKPFQSNVQDGKLFDPTFAAQSLINVLNRLTPAHSGKCFAWDGQEIPA